MPYEIRFTDRINKGIILVEDREINDTETSISFPGRQSTNYGQVIAENFLHMLENFASPSPPSNPVEGQTWYDNSPGIDQLKIYDGTNWVASGGLRKGPSEPDLGNSIEGDLWVDTANQQLYLNNGSNWLLVGPEFSAGLGSGTRSEQILGTDDQLYTILKFEVSNIPIAISSIYSFTPKTNIVGFNQIKAGLNITTRTINGTQLKYNGVAQAADALRIANLDVAATNFVRSDVDSTTSGILRVKNNGGIEAGTNSQIGIKAQGNIGIIQSNIANSGIDLKVKDDTGLQTVMRLKADRTVGINNNNPQEALDVTGNIIASGKVNIDSTELADSTFDANLTDGALVVAGGASIALNAKIGGDVVVKQNLNIGGHILVDENAISPSIGTEATPFENVHANTFFGNLTGSVTGTISGSATSASKLSNKTKFRMIGDVSSESFDFDGSGSLEKTFDTTISNEFITTKPNVQELQLGDEVLINRTTGDTGLYKITQTNFFKQVPKNPVGMVVPFAGNVTPAGWLICDGREIRKADAFALWTIIGHTFKAPEDMVLDSASHFTLPDFRGRFLLGRDNMGDSSAGTVTNISAEEVGRSGGSEFKDIKVENLPQHTHDFKTPADVQHYAIRDDLTSQQDSTAGNVNNINISTGTSSTSGLTDSGGISNGGPYRGTEQLGDAFDVMPPYATINYIIFADNV